MEAAVVGVATVGLAEPVFESGSFTFGGDGLAGGDGGVALGSVVSDGVTGQHAGDGLGGGGTPNGKVEW